MLDYTIHTISVFTSPLSQIYTTPMPTLCFFVTPPKLIKWDEHAVQFEGPCLTLTPANTRFQMEHGASRRNWAALIDSTDIRASTEPVDIEIRSQGHWHRVPALIPIIPAFVTTLEHEWQEMRDAYLEGLPGGRLSARIGIANQMKRLIDYRRPHSDHAPAAKLKRLIDEDNRYSQNLDELSNRCGFSTDHMRILFKQAYGIPPNKYRNQRRMAVAMELIANSSLSIKEIGVQVGCRHMSHFSSLLRKEFGIAPREAIKRYRTGGLTP